VPVSVWVRLPLATLLVAWGARSDRRWVLPVGVFLALPTIWINSPAILVGLLPLAEIGASTPAAAWLRGEPVVRSRIDELRLLQGRRSRRRGAT
jgi:hypothetical protein